MTGSSSAESALPAPDPARDHERIRRRLTWRIAAAGPLLGVLGAAASAAIGLPGQVGLAVVLVGVALGAVTSALATGVLAVVDEARRRPVARSRLVLAVALFAGGGLALLLAGGALTGA